MFGLLKGWSRGIPGIQIMRSAKATPKTSVLTVTIYTGSTCKESEKFKPSGYVSGRGESIIFDDEYPATDHVLDYVSVPAGNVYITRHCRRLTKKAGESVYAVYRNKTSKIPAAHKGLHIPKIILEQVESDYEGFRRRGSESLWRRLDKEFPKMPPADKNEESAQIPSK